MDRHEMSLEPSIAFIEGSPLCRCELRTEPVEFPEGLPGDVVEFFTRFQSVGIFVNRKNEVNLHPLFSETTYDQPIKDLYEPPGESSGTYDEYRRCYSLGCFQAGNEQILLDLNTGPARIIDFFYGPAIYYEECTELGATFTDWLAEHLAFGPDESLLRHKLS
jgi:hypothetical protein